MRGVVALLVVVAGLSGCGQKADSSGNTTAVANDAFAASHDIAPPAANTGTPSGWNAADACSILDKAAASAILKHEIASTQLSLVHEADASNAATSECAYLGEDGASVARLMTRWSPIERQHR